VLALGRPFGGRARTDVLAFRPTLKSVGSACALLVTTDEKRGKRLISASPGITLVAL
jgi:hypothetical protein